MAGSKHRSAEGLRDARQFEINKQGRRSTARIKKGTRIRAGEEDRGVGGRTPSLASPAGLGSMEALAM
jgi:hypothetical protein